MRRLLLAAVLCAGCVPSGAAIDPSTAAPTAAKVAAWAPRREMFDREAQVDAIHEALKAGAQFLTARAGEDGAWRSSMYPPFKDGASLTPHCLRALAAAGSDHPAANHGQKFLAGLVVDNAIRPGPEGISYPVYTAAGGLLAASEPETRQIWRRHLLAQQLTANLGWELENPRHGGWSYAHEPPRRPAPGKPVPTLSEPNLSATVFALDALHAADLPTDSPVWAGARLFLERLQNFQPDPALRSADLDDGGFCFVLDDVVRNKAGAAGEGRFASYGSTTADGLRALLRCGLPHDHPRVVAARRWLERNFRADSHPGRYAADREFARESLYFYYAAGVALTFEACGKREFETIDGKRVDWADALSKALVARQAADGSWRNKAVDVREDDPLVATPLAMLALAACRRVMVHRPESLP